jgi:hypothetical protein
MTDLQKRRLADALTRLAKVDHERNARRIEYEISLSALVAKEREHASVLVRVEQLKREAGQ